MTDIAETLPIEPRKPIVFKVKNFIDAEKFKADLTYSMVDLNDAFMKQAGLASYYGDLHAMAVHQVNDIKLKLKIAEAKVYRNTRDGAVEKGSKFTEPYLAACVTAHPLVIALEKGLNEAKQIAANCAVAVEAFHQRKGMLEQQGHDSRQERSGEFRIMEQSAREAILERAKARVASKE
jgi:hypothetical protein